jgi:hypothetical protein
VFASRRLIGVALVAVVVAALAAFALRPERGVPGDAPTLEAMARAVGAPIMRNVYRGHVPGRSGDIMLVPKPHRYIIGAWDLTTLGTDDPELYTSHPNPWNYLTRVPIVLRWPGRIRQGIDVGRVVDIADLAPTYATVLGMDDFDAAGTPLTEAFERPGDRTRPRLGGRRPKLIFSVVVDGGGWNVLQEHPESHPAIDRLRTEGTTYTNATLGSAPSITGALHATFGTGDYPLRTGIPGNQMRSPRGEVDEEGDPRIDAWLQNADPRYLKEPTVSELWDERNANKPVVGTVSYEGWHLGMIGHGAQRRGGDKDFAVLWEAAEKKWWINEDYYELPAYLEDADLDALERYEAELDRRDGLADGRWFGHTLQELREDATRPGTPAFTRFTGDAVIEVLRREEIGTDDLTDIVWIELKPPDFGGHIWNMERPEQADLVREADRQIDRFRGFLDRTIGKRDYLFALSADHGQQPLPDARGGWRINSVEFTEDLNERFDAEVAQVVTPVDVYLDASAMKEAGVSADDVARYIGTYTIGDNLPEGAPGIDRVPTARLDETLFAGAFSSRFLRSLDEQTIASFGAGEYSESDLSVGSG